jgi:hypothetical protein
LQGKPKYSKKTLPSAAFPTRNSTWPGLGSNWGHRGGKPAAISLSKDTAR